MEMIIIGVVLVVLAAGGLYLHSKIKNRRQAAYDGYVPYPNGKGGSIQLTRVNGCGMSFVGEFRNSFAGGMQTYITYYTLYFLFIPLIPFGAYRVANAENGGYHILGSEEASNVERGLIILNMLSWVAILGGVICIIAGIANF